MTSVTRAVLVLVLLPSLAACGESEAEKASASSAAPSRIVIGQENIVTVKRERIVSGPLISGELRPQREATVRAELGGSIDQVRVEEGQHVRKGTLLGRIEATTLDDAYRSAQSAVRSAEHQLEVAHREAERTALLVSAGALAVRDLDLAKSNVSVAEAQRADAEAKLVTARKQLNDAVVRAPIDGIVSKRSVNAGDVVTNGAELFTIIDPSSMRLDASVPSDELRELRVGAPVQFTVRGYDRAFEGRIERVSPAADPVTRQVPIFVDIPNVQGLLVAGLYAEGRVVSESATGLVVPENAINTSANAPWVLRVANGETDRVDVTLGLRDPHTERVQIRSGVNEEDILLRGAAQGIAPGTLVSLTTSRSASTPPSASTPVSPR